MYHIKPAIWVITRLSSIYLKGTRMLSSDMKCYWRWKRKLCFFLTIEEIWLKNNKSVLYTDIKCCGVF